MNSREKWPNRYELRECPQCGEEKLIRKTGTYCSKRCARLAEDRWGEANHRWKGDDAGYVCLHKRVHRRRGNAKAHTCKCGKQAEEWANLTGDYADVDDYEAMCVQCHNDYDKERRVSA